MVVLNRSKSGIDYINIALVKKNHNTRIAEPLSRKVQLYELFTSRRDSDKQNSTIHTHTGDIVKRFNSGPTHECSAHVHLDSFPRPRRPNTRVSLPGACAAITVLNYIGTCGTDPVNFVCNRVAELAHRRLIAFPIKHIAIWLPWIGGGEGGEEGGHRSGVPPGGTRVLTWPLARSN